MNGGQVKPLQPLFLASSADIPGGHSIVLRSTWVDMGQRSRELQTMEIAVVSNVSAETVIDRIAADAERFDGIFEAVLPWSITDDPWSWLDALRTVKSRRLLAQKMLEACT